MAVAAFYYNSTLCSSQNFGKQISSPIIIPMLVSMVQVTACLYFFKIKRIQIVHSTWLPKYLYGFYLALV
jgi:hypothetical protein